MPSNDTDTTAEHQHQQQIEALPTSQQQQPFSLIARRKHSKTTDDVLTSLSVVEVEISEEERQKRKEEGIIGKCFVHQLDRPPLARSKSLDELEMAHNRMNPPTTLATVLENMPLVYNTATKRLERAVESSSLTMSTRDGSPLCAVASSNGNCIGNGVAADMTNGEQKTPKPFKRGHIRHSSYESSQIQLLATPMAPPFVGRTNSLNRTVMPSMGSLSLRDAECSTSAASIETGQTVDSAIGESVSSKRSSLDRKSQTSVVDWGSDLESHSSPREDDGFAEDDAATAASDDRGAKRRGLPLPSISLPRGLFSRNKQTTTPSAAPWKLFGDRRASKDPSIVSTTGLILENRPSNLPAKSEEEEARHRQQYLELIEAAKKKEHKEAKERKRAKELQRRLEDQAAAACRQWSDQILPKWDEMKNSKRCRELWWQGVPAKVRGRVWSLMIGNDLNLTEELYSICCARAKERLAQAAAEAEQARHPSPDGSLCSVSKVDPATLAAAAASSSADASDRNHKRSASSCLDHDSPTVDREGTVELIHLDVSRTFPSLGIFQKGGPYYDLLLNLVGAYVCYRPDVGYVQSMSFVAAVLLLQMEPYEAFVAFANLLNRPLQLAFFRLRQPQMTEYFIAYDQYFEQELPKLHAHFDQLDVRPDLYLIEWVYTLYAKSLPLDVTCRVWDMFLRDGEEFLFKTALGILRTFEQQLLVSDFEDVVQFLAHLPDSLSASELFRNIEPFMRPYANTGESAKCKRRFLQILEDVNSRINPSPTSNDKLGHARRPSDSSQCSQLSQLSSNVQNVKMSKSLSGFLGDLLRPPPHEETA